MSEYAATSALLAEHLNAKRFGDPRLPRLVLRRQPPRQGHRRRHRRRSGPPHRALRRAAHDLPHARRTDAVHLHVERGDRPERAPQGSVPRDGRAHLPAGRGHRRARARGHVERDLVGDHRRALRLEESRPDAGRGRVSRRAAPRHPRRCGERRVPGRRRVQQIASDLDWVPVHDWAQSWSVDFLRWRLSNPDATYTLHIGPDALAVSTRDHGPLGAPAAVLCKMFPRPGATLPIRTAPYVTAACRAHRAPVCVYAGWNRHAHVQRHHAPDAVPALAARGGVQVVRRGTHADRTLPARHLRVPRRRRVLMASAVTFTLDVEDYTAPGSNPRAVDTTRARSSDFSAERGVRGTFFVVGEFAEQQSGS